MYTSFVANRVKARSILKSFTATELMNGEIKMEGKFMIVTVFMNEAGVIEPIAEDVYTTDGILKQHDTDLLVVSTNLPDEIINHYKNQDYRKLIMLDM